MIEPDELLTALGAFEEALRSCEWITATEKNAALTPLHRIEAFAEAAQRTSPTMVLNWLAGGPPPGDAR